MNNFAVDKCRQLLHEQFYCQSTVKALKERVNRLALDPMSKSERTVNTIFRLFSKIDKYTRNYNDIRYSFLSVKEPNKFKFYIKHGLTKYLEKFGAQQSARSETRRLSEQAQIVLAFYKIRHYLLRQEG